MAVRGENGSMIGRPAPGQKPSGGSFENLIVRLRDHLKINEETGCWEWTGATIKKGYGVIRVGKRHLLYVHRVMLELILGRPLEAKERSLHRCDNPPCGNPEHLFVGTTADNNRDADRKGRSNHWGRQRRRSACPS